MYFQQNGMSSTKIITDLLTALMINISNESFMMNQCYINVLNSPVYLGSGVSKNYSPVQCMSSASHGCLLHSGRPVRAVRRDSFEHFPPSTSCRRLFKHMHIIPDLASNLDWIMSNFFQKT